MQQIVLLNAFEKPNDYEKGLKKKVDRQYEKILIQTQGYYKEFINNPKNYEEYKQEKS